jgi:hypothetical protein
MKQKLIYISGKMGEKVLSYPTIDKFEKAQEKLLSEGWAIFNPASPKYQRDMNKHVKIEEKKWQDFEWGKFDWYSWLLLYDMHMLAMCDAIYMLKDWRDSPGATAEYYYAKACNKEVIFEE